MGYESKVYIVERLEVNKRHDGTPLEKPHISAQIVAAFDLCKMGWKNQEFYNAFKRKIDYTLFLPSFDAEGNEVMAEVNEDCYGEHLKAADLGDVIAALNAAEQREHYRRIPPLVAMLTAFSLGRDEWEAGENRLEVVHYGY